jgi:uncharacterized membrane protein
MAKDVGTVIGRAVGHAARDATKQVAKNASASLRQRNGSLNGTVKGVAAGVGIAALAPLAGRVAKKQLVDKPAKKVGKKVEGAKDAVGEKLGDLAGKGEPGAEIGSSRRMPIQQAVDVSLPISTVYNQWTQFEEWPEFMHRLDRVSQDDESHVSFKTKIWGMSKEFSAEIVEQRPDELIRWRVTDGVTHEGVVSFHELAPRLTRVDVDLYVQPGSLIEKAARGMRHVKRAVRADLARFKAFAELQQEESGAWRGAIEDAKVKSSRSGSRSGSSRRSKSSAKSSSNGRRSSSSGRSQSRSSSRGRSQPRSSSSGRSQSRSSSARSRSGSNGTRGATNSGSRSGSRSRSRARS